VAFAGIGRAAVAGALSADVRVPSLSLAASIDTPAAISTPLTASPSPSSPLCPAVSFALTLVRLVVVGTAGPDVAFSLHPPLRRFVLVSLEASYTPLGDTSTPLT